MIPQKVSEIYLEAISTIVFAGFAEFLKMSKFDDS